MEADSRDLADVAVLIVEDQDHSQKLLEINLKGMGFVKFFWAGDGETALQILRTESPGLILSDRNMPSMNGLELFKALKNNARLKDIPFILITSQHSKEDVRKALELGIKHYIVKPFTREVLENKIREVMGLSR